MMSWGDSSSPRPTQDRSKSSLAGMLKQQFRQLAKALTLPPAAKRRRTDETRGAFKMAVAKLIRWTKPRKLPKESPTDTPGAWDEMQWRQFWGEHWDGYSSPAGASHDCERPEMAFDPGHFSPGL
jgi:hypothetical protein